MSHATTNPKTIVLFGETGSGKSSVINLIAGEEVAKTSGGLEACTMDAESHQFDLPDGMSIQVYDTVGLEEPDLGINGFLQAILKAQALVSSLSAAGGIDLLIFCMRGARMTLALQRTYRLFFEFLCDKKVPLVVVVTHLEHEDNMEDWWTQNKMAFEKYRISAVRHACITAAPPRLNMFEEKREQSRQVLLNLLSDTLGDGHHPYAQDTHSWFMRIIIQLQLFVKDGKVPKRDKLVKELVKRCSLNYADAETLAVAICKDRKPKRLSS